MTARKLFILVIVMVEWYALTAQLMLHLRAVQTGLGESLIRYFSYFTILTNLLVAVYATVLLFTPAGAEKGFLFKPSVQTGIALYIVVVGLVYNIVLRQLWDSTGLQAVLHDLLHTLTPLLVLIYWWRWVDARNLIYKGIFVWQLYPAVYALTVMARGHSPKWYPYPFLDADKLGYGKVLLNSAGLVLVFLFFSLLFVFLGQRKRFPGAAI